MVRVEEIKAPGGKQGVGVQLDCYEVSRSTPVHVAIGAGMPVRMLCDVAERRPNPTIEKRAIVDDEPATCELIEKVLSSAGIESLDPGRAVVFPLLHIAFRSRWDC